MAQYSANIPNCAVCARFGIGIHIHQTLNVSCKTNECIISHMHSMTWHCTVQYDGNTSMTPMKATIAATATMTIVDGNTSAAAYEMGESSPLQQQSTYTTHYTVPMVSSAWYILCTTFTCKFVPHILAYVHFDIFYIQATYRCILDIFTVFAVTKIIFTPVSIFVQG